MAATNALHILTPERVCTGVLVIGIATDQIAHGWYQSNACTAQRTQTVRFAQR